MLNTEKQLGGNITDKYNTKNPIFRIVMKNFFKAFDSLICPLRGDIADVLEVGCGEGYLARHLANAGFSSVRAIDVSPEIICVAKSAHALKNISFQTKNVYELSASDSADLIVCCEVLEHLDRPHEALEVLRAITKKYCLLSVPDEPIFRMLNVARGAYLRNFGNTPGHIQHWSHREFMRFAGSQFEIAQMRRPLPWTMLLCVPKK